MKKRRDQKKKLFVWGYCLLKRLELIHRKVLLLASSLLQNRRDYIHYTVLFCFLFQENQDFCIWKANLSLPIIFPTFYKENSSSVRTPCDRKNLFMNLNGNEPLLDSTSPFRKILCVFMSHRTTYINCQNENCLIKLMRFDYLMWMWFGIWPFYSDRQIKYHFRRIIRKIFKHILDWCNILQLDSCKDSAFCWKILFFYLVLIKSTFILLFSFDQINFCKIPSRDLINITYFVTIITCLEMMIMQL